MVPLMAMVLLFELWPLVALLLVALGVGLAYYLFMVRPATTREYEFLLNSRFDPSAPTEVRAEPSEQTICARIGFDWWAYVWIPSNPALGGGVYRELQGLAETLRRTKMFPEFKYEYANIDISNHPALPRMPGVLVRFRVPHPRDAGDILNRILLTVQTRAKKSPQRLAFLPCVYPLCIVAEYAPILKRARAPIPEVTAEEEILPQPPGREVPPEGVVSPEEYRRLAEERRRGGGGA